MLSEMLFQKLLEQRYFYLNTLKHPNFQLVVDLSKNELKDIKIMQIKIIDQLKKVEHKLASILSEKSY